MPELYPQGYRRAKLTGNNRENCSGRPGVAPRRNEPDREVTMCSPVICPDCGKTTWVGCGLHVDQVMRDVPVDERCTCPREDAPVGA